MVVLVFYKYKISLRVRILNVCLFFHIFIKNKKWNYVHWIKITSFTIHVKWINVICTLFFQVLNALCDVIYYVCLAYSVSMAFLSNKLWCKILLPTTVHACHRLRRVGSSPERQGDVPAWYGIPEWGHVRVWCRVPTAGWWNTILLHGRHMERFPTCLRGSQYVFVWCLKTYNKIGEAVQDLHTFLHFNNW